MSSRSPKKDLSQSNSNEETKEESKDFPNNNDLEAQLQSQQGQQQEPQPSPVKLARRSIPVFHGFSKWNKILSHSCLFGVQSIAFCLPNAIFPSILKEAGIITQKTMTEIPRLFGIIACFFFVGRTISDPLWGWIRDKYGDKRSILSCVFSLMIATVCFGLSRTFLLMNIASFFIGLSSGVYTPGYSFMNWIDLESRPTLSLLVNVFNGMGVLAGPIIGSSLAALFSNYKAIKIWGIMSIFIFISLIWFFWSFADFDDLVLIGKAEGRESGLGGEVELQEGFKVKEVGGGDEIGGLEGQADLNVSINNEGIDTDENNEDGDVDYRITKIGTNSIEESFESSKMSSKTPQNLFLTHISRPNPTPKQSKK